MIALFPVLLFSNTDNEYAYSFSCKLRDQQYEECYQLLDNWSSVNPTIISQIKVLRGMIYLAEGKLQECIFLMDEAIIELRIQEFPKETLQCITQWYEKALTKDVEYISFSFDAADPRIMLCKGRQPKGTKLKYWFGVAQIVAGCVVAPFSGGAATGLIIGGFRMTTTAVAESLNNIEEWEKNIQERQKIHPDNSNYLQKNAFHRLGGECGIRTCVYAMVS